MPRKPDEYTANLATTLDRLFANGKFEVTGDEIAEAHFGTTALGGEILDGVRKRLHTLCRIMEEEYDYRVCLLSSSYYKRQIEGRSANFRTKPPETEHEARLCLPIGGGKQAIGIHLCRGPDDLIYQASLTQNLAAGGGKVARALGHTVAAMANGQISVERGRSLLSAVRKRIGDFPELEDAVMPSLVPAPEVEQP